MNKFSLNQSSSAIGSGNGNFNRNNSSSQLGVTNGRKDSRTNYLKAERPNVNDSIEEFNKDLDAKHQKTSFMAKYSPRKSRRGGSMLNVI